MGVPTSKIEDRSIRALENIIDNHSTMTYNFNRQDKEMCWDGFIATYNSLESQSKKTFEDRIPVQIKGHIDENLACTKKKRISYPVSIDDLLVFYKDRGVLYFQIFLSETGKDNQIFYTSLFASKLKTYIEEAEKKGNSKTKNIPFNRLINGVQELDSIVKRFSIESKAQGSGEGQIVPKTIPFDDLKKTSEITFLPGGISNNNEFFQRLSAGDISFYINLQNGIKIPIEWTDEFKAAQRKKINESIYIGNRLFYDSFEIYTDSEGNSTLILSDNLSFDINTDQMEFCLKTSFNQLRTDAEFLLEAAQSTSPIRTESVSLFPKEPLEKDFKTLLNLIIDIDDILNMIEFQFVPPKGRVTEAIMNQLSLLIDIKEGKYNEKINHQNNLYPWKITNKYMPIMIYRNGDKIELRNAIYTKSHRLFMADKCGNRYTVPLFYALNNSVFSNMYYYDYDYLKEQIDIEDVDEFTFQALNDCAVLLIGAYDATGDQKLLDLAKYQIDKIEELEKDDIMLLLNKMQIKVREGTFDSNDKDIVQNIKSNGSLIRLCQNIILGNFEDASVCLNQITEEDKKLIEDWPIMNLYKP